MFHWRQDTIDQESSMDSRPLHVVAWGTYDTGKPRVRILLRGLRENGVSVHECHWNVWHGIEDKSQIRNPSLMLRVFFRWLIAYPILAWKYITAPAHDIVLIGYMGQIDTLFIWPLARLRGATIAIDLFLSLYDTVVLDRQLIGRRNPLAKILYCGESFAIRAADLVLLDTTVHADYVADLYSISRRKFASVLVGAEQEHFQPVAVTRTLKEPSADTVVLFYGQFTPLHGVSTIVEAALLTAAEPIQWNIIGDGQCAPEIQRLLDKATPRKLKWDHWVEYEKLNERISAADVCLGIFGGSGKATRVIPNKVFQILAAGRPLITADTPAIRELFQPTEWLRLIPGADPKALASTVLALRRQLVGASDAPVVCSTLRHKISPTAIGAELKTVFQDFRRC